MFRAGAERFGGLEVDDQLELHRRLDAKLALLAASRLKHLHQVPGRISQKNLRAAGSGHGVIAELHAGSTQSCDLAGKIIHNKMDAVPATSFGASAIRHGPPG
jgi:type IV secretory pathway ATPase VirB11/archaellum biosynthesis ATPase